MGYEYGYGSEMGMEPFADSGMMDGAMAGVGGFVIAFVLLFYFLMIGFGIACYVLQSVGFYTIAKRRGIKNPWLCWLPVGDAWILGSISDQYNYVAKGKVKNRRKLLLGLAIGAYTILICWLVSYIGWIVGMVAFVEEEVIGGMFGATMGAFLIFTLFIAVVGIVNTIMQYIALYDVFTSCNPDSSVIFLVLSILINVTLPFLIFTSRNKDLGMPPRKVIAEIPQETVAQEEDFEQE